ncbi:MAG TPA: hypothetical protein VFX80_11350 [Solirubrobacteraceae bacterium]|nr:hypothetical protein [Solirubrobacteraceae bacterium]
MDPATLARGAAVARAGIGVALLTAPGPVGKRWLGDASERPGAQVAISGLGARDLAVGLGALWALGGRRRGARAWLIASAAADLADLVATVRLREGLSTPAVAGTAALAGGSALLHAWLQSELG